MKPDYSLLSPEYILTGLGLLILVGDWFTPEDKKRRLAWIGLVGLTIALIASFRVALRTTAEGSVLPGWAATQLEIDLFSSFFKLIIIVATILVLMACPDYVERRIRTSQGEFYALIIFVTLGMSLMAASKDLISLYLALEFTSITSYILAGYHKTNPKSSEAGMKYFLIGVVSSGVMLYGMSLVYGASGSTDITVIAERIKNAKDNPLLMPAVVMVLAGFAFKMALAPFHMWCPDTYEGAPTPFTALLSVGPKAAGFAMMMRVFLKSFYALAPEWKYMIAIIAALTMTVGNLAAISQTNLKRMLAYSSIAQAGYMLIGMAAMDTRNDSWRFSGMLLYLFSYTFMNVGAFVCAIVLLDGADSEEIPATANFIRRAPFTTVCFLIFVASLAGLPATAGFVAKAMVFGAAIDAHMTWLAVVGWLNTVVSVYYYFNVVKYMFGFPPTAHAGHDSHAVQPESAALIPSPMPLQICLAMCASLTVFIGVYPQPFIELAKGAAGIFGE